MIKSNISSDYQYTRFAVLAFCVWLLFTPNSSFAETGSFKIGASLMLTGEYSNQGIAFREGMELALDKIENDSERTFDLVVKDSKGDEQQEAENIRRLIVDEKVSSIVTMSYPSLKVGFGELSTYKVPVLSLWDSSPELDALSEYIFTLGPWAPSPGEVAAQFAAGNLKKERAVIFHTTDEWSKYVSDSFKKRLLSMGGQVLQSVEVVPEQVSFRTLFESVAHLKPQVVFAPVTFSFPLFFKQAKKILPDSVLMTTALVTKEKIQKDPSAFEGIYRSDLSEPDSYEAKELFVAYKKKFGREPKLLWYVATGFDAIMILNNAFEVVGGKGEDIKSHLARISDHKGASRIISMRDGRSSPAFESMYRVENGTIVPVQIEEK